MIGDKIIMIRLIIMMRLGFMIGMNINILIKLFFDLSLNRNGMILLNIISFMS